MGNKEKRIYEKMCEFMKQFSVDCVEAVFQRDSVNEACVDLVGELVEIMLEDSPAKKCQ